MAEEFFDTANTHRAYLQQRISPSWMKGTKENDYAAEGFFGCVLALPADEGLEAMTLACRMSLVDDTQSPSDVLPKLAADRRLIKYVLETNLEWRLRLHKAWDIYEGAATELSIEQQLLAAKFGPTTFFGDYGNTAISYGDSSYFYADLGCFVEFRIGEPGPRGEPPPYRTQFWIVMNDGFNPITDSPKPWGSWAWGDTSEGVWGYVGLDAHIGELLWIAQKFKDVMYVFRGYTFILNSLAYGDETVTYGDSTIPYGTGLEWPFFY